MLCRRTSLTQRDLLHLLNLHAVTKQSIHYFEYEQLANVEGPSITKCIEAQLCVKTGAVNSSYSSHRHCFS